ncbi:MAG: heparinase II/III family protein [Planctomycetota bacterium]|nr:heparinase II/III family protein [Planctomycetota bacterium]
MKTIFDACTPRAEVLTGELKEQQFAASLTKVLRGTADAVYGDAVTFFANTFPTEGLKSLLQEALGRLSGKHPDSASVIRLETSHIYPAAGYAVLQQGQGRDATWLCLKYGPHGGGHGHPDKLNFILYSRGKVLGFDPGTGKYGVPLHTGWQKTTVAHNTLTVDESNQTAATGRCLEFVSQPDHVAALADAGPIHDGVTYRRAVAVIGSDVVLVLDLVRATKEHTFDVAYHNMGVWSSQPSGDSVTMPDKPGYRYLEGMVQVTGPLPLIKHDLVQVGLAVVAAEGGSVWAGTGAGGVSRERVPCVILRTKGQAAVVGWALALNGTVPTVRVVPAGSGAMVEAQVGGKTYRLSADPEGQEKLKLQ